MSRRSAAQVLAFVLVFGFGAVIAVNGVPFVRFQPGPTVDVLGKQSDGDRIVQVKGHRTYPTSGELRMLTVRTTRPDTTLSLVQALQAWADPHDNLYPYEIIYPEPTSDQEQTEESQQEMVSSQDHAVAAAMLQLGYDVTSPVVAAVESDGAADGVLKAGDAIDKVGDEVISTRTQVADAVAAVRPGSTVRLAITRKSKKKVVEVTTQANPDDASKSMIGISMAAGEKYDFPFSVKVDVPETIGGPSAGLIFALSIYDTLTPGKLLDGNDVAGTGEVDSEGTVGPIGGIRQKIAAAEAEGATLFLVPPGNCDEAMVAHTDMRLVRADNVSSAITSIRAYAADHDATLPQCPKEPS
ncbi:MAG: PDZ domain-containing protein [Nocardioidaceae bacterium]